MPQQAWVQNATLQDNILFGKDFHHSYYHKIVKASALQQDIDMLPGGDSTEIGEKVVVIYLIKIFIVVGSMCVRVVVCKCDEMCIRDSSCTIFTIQSL